MDSLNVLLAQAAGGAAGQPSPLGFIVPMGLVIVMMYFLMIRPQQQNAKRQSKLLEALKAGDRVVTSSGIVGVVITVKDKSVPPSVSLRTADTKMEVTKASIAEILPASTSTES